MERTVKSKILLGSTGVSSAGFGVPLILGAHNHFPERVRFYSTPDALEEDLPAGSTELLFGLLAMQQRPSATTIAIGRQDATGATKKTDVIAFPAAVADGDVFTVSVDGFVVAKYEAGATDDDKAVATALTALINKSPVYVTAAVASGDKTIDLTGNWVGVNYVVTITGPVGTTVTAGSAAVAPTETETAALSAIEAENPNFYGVCTISRDSAVIASVAGWCETRQKYYVTQTADADVITAVDTDVASTLKGLSLQKTAVFYAREPWFGYDVAILSNRLAVDPDVSSTTWNLVRLVGVPTTKLTETEEKNLFDKNVFYYVDDGAGGASIGGKSIGGEWVDVIIGVDWFNARLQEATYAYVKSMTNVGKKVPYTDAGVNTLEAILRRRLDAAKATGFIAEDPAPEIQSPRVLEVDPVKRQARELPPIQWNARLAGAIHFTNFQGVLVP